MSLIRRRIIPLPFKDMAQMPTAVAAHDLRALHTERLVRMSRHRAGDAVKVRGPAAAALELVVGLVERRAAGCARVHAGVRVVLVELVGEGRFGAFFAEDAELFCWG
jgi:hypothetical protein